MDFLLNMRWRAHRMFFVFEYILLTFINVHFLLALIPLYCAPWPVFYLVTSRCLGSVRLCQGLLFIYPFCGG